MSHYTLTYPMTPCAFILGHSERYICFESDSWQREHEDIYPPYPGWTLNLLGSCCGWPVGAVEWEVLVSECESCDQILRCSMWPVQIVMFSFYSVSFFPDTEPVRAADRRHKHSAGNPFTEHEPDHNLK